jgi:ATP/maltotriose-dependent transcriptional regulator MalT
VTGSVSVPLIRTKITIPPLRPQMVVRKRLFGLLDDGIKLPLTLISAPAGSGKTSLIISWLHEHEEKIRAGWLSLDDDERDPVHLVSYIIAALQSVEAMPAYVPASLLDGSGVPRLETLTALLLNAIADTQHRSVLVLDDYHRASSAATDSAVTFLVERLPENLRLIIATREEPPNGT